MKTSALFTLLVCLVLSLCSCGPATKGRGDVRFTTISLFGTHNQIVVHWEEGINPTLKSHCVQSAWFHVDAFQNKIFQQVQYAVGIPLVTPGHMDVWVYSSAQGRATPTGIDIAPGRGGTLPDLTKLLTRAYYPNTPPYTVSFAGLQPPSMPFWSYVDQVNAEVMKIVNFLFVPYP